MKNLLFFTAAIFISLQSVGQALLVSVGNDVSICSGTSSQLNAAVSGGKPPYKYHWSPSTGLSNDTILNPIASPIITTTYSLSVTDSNSNSAIDSITVTVVPLPHAGFTVDTFATNCPPLLVNFTGTSTGINQGTTIFNFDFGDGHSSKGTNQDVTHLYTLPDTIRPILIATNPTGCSDTFHFPGKIIVGGPKVTSFSVTPTSGCAPLSVTFTFNSNALNAIWSLCDTEFVTNKDTVVLTYHYPGVCDNFVILADGACNYPLFLDTIQVFDPIIYLVSTDTTVCKGDTIPIEVRGANTYTIIPSLTQLNKSTFLAHPIINTSYKIIGTDLRGCIDSTIVSIAVDTSCITTGISVPTFSPSPFNLNIYPNPSYDKITIAFGKEVADELQIRNLLGESILTFNDPRQTNTIDVSALPPGIYSLIATSKQNRLVRKIVVQK